jgi:hypothetical protein
MTTNKDLTNEGRGDIALRALEAGGYCTDPEELSASIYDLVADLLHLARLNDVEPDYVIHMAQMHFDTEVEEEAIRLGIIT